MSVDNAIGDTPLIELTKIGLPDRVRVFAKIEYMNPGLSIKVDGQIHHRPGREKRLTQPATRSLRTPQQYCAAIALLSLRALQGDLTMPDQVSEENKTASGAGC